MTKGMILVALCSLLLAPCSAVEAQQPKKVPRIGHVDAGSPATTGHRAKAFVQGLRDLGYVEGENILIDYQWANRKLERLPVLVEDIVRLRVDVIVSSAAPTAGSGTYLARTTIKTDLLENQNIPCTACQECGHEQIGQLIQKKIDKLFERAAKGKLKSHVVVI